MNAPATYLLNVLKWLDEGCNVFFVPILCWIFRINDIPAAGRDCYTVSQFCAEMRERGHKFGCTACYLLTQIFKPFYKNNPHYDHCTSAMDGMPENVNAG